MMNNRGDKSPHATNASGAMCTPTVERSHQPNGNLITSRVMDGYGNILSGDPTFITAFDQDGNYEEDANSGYKLLGYRYYDASIGQFLSADPAMVGSNWFAYCGNDPVNEEDPAGLRAINVEDGIFDSPEGHAVESQPVPYQQDWCDAYEGWCAGLRVKWPWMRSVDNVINIGESIPGCLPVPPAAGGVGMLETAGETVELGESIGAEAQDIGSARDLARALASEQQMSEPGMIIAGGAKGKPLGVANSLAQNYGGLPFEWVKMTSSSYKASEYDCCFETHWYENLFTGEWNKR